MSLTWPENSDVSIIQVIYSCYEITKSVLTLFEEHINLCLFFLNISSLRKSSHYVTDPRNDE